MIPFAEKLSFLMHIADVSNKKLAVDLAVDPSLISMMRTGRRKLPKNPAFTKKMAYALARRCPTVFQRQALSEMLGQVSISPGMPVEVLVDCLEKWILGEEEGLADAILTGMQPLPARVEEASVVSDAPAPVSKGETLFFYGEEGRQEVMIRMMDRMRQMETPGSILTVVDDNLEWLLSDYALTRKIQNGFLELSERGFTFTQIMPPLNYINRYTESLQFWLPIYVTGKTKVYYYPRLRGNLYRHSIIVVPGNCVQYSSSVAMGSTSDITMFSTDPQLVKAFEKQFQEHVFLCRPSLDVLQNPADFIKVFSEFFTRTGDVIQQVNSLSLNSMPRQLLEHCMQEASGTGQAETFALYLAEIPHFEARLKEDTYIDTCCLASAEQVRAGTVPVAAYGRKSHWQHFYTPETYCMHLRNILRLMDEYENYFFLPLEKKESPDYNLFVSEGGMALIARTVEPFIILEIQRPHMVTALREYLLRKVDSVGYDGIQREKARMELRALIQELES